MKKVDLKNKETKKVFKKIGGDKVELYNKTMSYKKNLFNKDIYNWLKSAKISCKRSTYSNYEYMVYAHLIPSFGSFSRKQINKDKINQFTDNLLNKGYSTKTVKDILVVLQQILKYVDVSIDVVMPKIRKKEIKIISKEYQQKLEYYISNNINLSNLGILLCLYTGLRIGELCALKWKNIDLDKKIISIDKTLIRVKNHNKDIKRKTIVILDCPKSLSSIRDIPIPKFILPVLKTFSYGALEEDFFLTGTLVSIEPRCYTNHYRKVLKNLEINYYNFHSLRHTFATRCIENNCDAKTLSEILGHSSVSITLQRYVHPSFENKVLIINNLTPMESFFKFNN